MEQTPACFCPLCGGDNQCARATTADVAAPCWCFNATVSKHALARVPAEKANKVCLCPRCAAGNGDLGKPADVPFTG
ncbi:MULTISPECIES: cysteine-rich CWC family protein [unclassified Marinobacter]|uniref:cysteine-rich CWC family protein n=1 Tax=unclassified Marinobacter TaxID=83889 RepID=UPI0026E149D2|nr:MULTISPECIES: cysteine-rich CWC family protein [unclassified Marinobacter]MDO6442312.1 cysteine-rich CWC family protein [Marinobacter sp. 2_MG-2023]MDO6824918.1 cysteine-rich CWC family protein [Marinobacter sp. 1_MG-2023]